MAAGPGSRRLLAYENYVGFVRLLRGTFVRHATWRDGCHSGGVAAGQRCAPSTIHAVPRARTPVVTARASMNAPPKAAHNHARPAAPSGAKVSTAQASGR